MVESDLPLSPVLSQGEDTQLFICLIFETGSPSTAQADLESVVLGVFWA